MDVCFRPRLKKNSLARRVGAAYHPVTMKTNMLVLVVGLLSLVVLAPCLSQEATSMDADYDSLFRSDGLYSTHFTLRFDKTLREVDNAGVVADLEAEHYYAVVGVDPLAWCTVSAGIGQSLISPVPDGSDEEPSMMWMVGAEARLWQLDVDEPSFLACKCRIDASASYWENNGEIFGRDVTWNETRAALIGRAEFFVDDLGSDLSVYPYSIVYSVGVVYSSLDGEIDVTAGMPPWAGFPVIDFGEQEDVGILAGINLKVAYNVALEWEARVYENVCHTIGIRYSF